MKILFIGSSSSWHNDLWLKYFVIHHKVFLYSDKVSPLGHAVRIVLAEKDVNVEINYTDDETKPEILNELNPYN